MKKFKMYMNLTFEASIEGNEKDDSFDLGDELELKCQKLIEEHMATLLCPHNEGCIEKIVVESDAWDEVV